MCDNDVRWMKVALNLARMAEGNSWPNPPVGCVIVKDNCPIGQGFTQKNGRPHAEVVALSKACSLASGSTAYVTLEPCSHQGVTGSCAVSLVESGIARVVIAMQDPDPRVNGGGIRILREAGINVETGVLENEALKLNYGFCKRINKGLPRVSIKIASSLDGRIATASNDSRWITNDLSRTRTHLDRGSHDAVLVGVGTVLVDDPMLDVRVGGIDKEPVCMVADTRLRIPKDSKIVKQAKQRKVWVFHGKDVDQDAKNSLEDLGVRTIKTETLYESLNLNGKREVLDIKSLLKNAAELGITSVLCEGGSRMVASLIKYDDIVDRLIFVFAGLILGQDAVSACANMGFDKLIEASRYSLEECTKYGNNIYSVWEKEV